MNSFSDLHRESGVVNLSTQELNLIGKAALSIPTGDNSQPFRLELMGGHLNIFHHNSIAKHSLNFQNHASFIALGALFEAIDVACTHLDLRSFFEELYDEDVRNSEGHLWARVSFLREKRTPSISLNSILERETHRTPYKKEPFTLEQFSKATDHPEENKGSFYISPPNKDLINTILDCDEYIWDKNKIVKDLTTWMRLTKKDKRYEKDGMSALKMGMNFIESKIVFTIIKRYPEIVKLLLPLGFRYVMRRRNSKILNSSSAFILFTTKSLDPKDLVLTGRRFLRFLFNITQMGYVSQPLSSASFILSSSKSVKVPAIMDSKFIKIFKEADVKIKRVFNVENSSEVMTWMFRIGKVDKNKRGEEKPARIDLKDFLKG